MMLRLAAVRPLGRSALLLVTTLLAPLPLHAEQWTDVTGTRTMEAELLGMWGNQAIFRKPDGSRVAVAVNLLQAESRLRAQKLAQEMAEQRAARIAELARAAEAEMAPAPTEVPPSPEAPAYEPLPAAADLQQTVQHVDAQLRNGHLRVFWDALPAKYQSDLEALTIQFATKMDPQLWQTQLGAVRRVTDLLVSRQNWVLSHPLLVVLAEQTDGAPEQLYPPLVRIVRALTDPQSFALQRLGKGDLAALIADRDSVIAADLRQLQVVVQSISAAPQPQPEVKMLDKTRGTVTWQPPPLPDAPPTDPAQPIRSQQPRLPGAAQPRSVIFVQVEGRWVPEAMAKDWDARIEAAKQKLDALPESLESYRTVVNTLVQRIDQVLGPLERAQTRDQFHAQMNEIAAMAMMSMMQPSDGRQGTDAQQPYGGGGEGYDGGGEGYDGGGEGYGETAP